MADERSRPASREGGLSTADLATAAREQERRPEPERTPPPRDVRPQERREATGPEAAETEGLAALLAEQEAHGFRSRWDAIQAGFVDSPRDAVEHADSLVAELMTRLAESFSQARQELERQWSRGEDVSTEDLRQALRRYRSFFERLLSI